MHGDRNDLALLAHRPLGAAGDVMGPARVVQQDHPAVEHVVVADGEYHQAVGHHLAAGQGHRQHLLAGRRPRRTDRPQQLGVEDHLADVTAHHRVRPQAEQARYHRVDLKDLTVGVHDDQPVGDVVVQLIEFAAGELHLRHGVRRPQRGGHPRRQSNGERRTGVRRAAKIKTAAHHLRVVLGDVQLQAQALGLRPQRVIGAKELMEDLSLLGAGDANTGVGNADQVLPAAVAAHGQADHPLTAGVADRVIHQNLQHLTGLHLVGDDRRQACGKLHHHPAVVGLRHRLDVVGQRGQQQTQVQRLGSDGDLALVNARNAQQVVDDTGHEFHLAVGLAQVLQLGGRQLAYPSAGQHVQRPADDRDGSAQLVAGNGDEVGLHPVGSSHIRDRGSWGHTAMMLGYSAGGTDTRPPSTPPVGCGCC